MALLLAAVGIYGTLSYVVRARSRDIGIRLALGASRRTIMSQTAWRGVWPALGGGVIGLALAIVIARVFQAGSDTNMQATSAQAARRVEMGWRFSF